MSVENKMIRNMRHMAWERAKGELHSMRRTFWGGEVGTGESQFDKFTDEVDKFIKKIEDDGLYE